MATKPYSVLCRQVLILVVGRFRAENTLVQTGHDVLLHLVHHPLHRLRGTWRGQKEALSTAEAS